MQIYGRTDRGRVRTINEDCFAVDTARGIAVLADGMGGLDAGEIASACAVEAVMSDLRDAVARGAADSDPAAAMRAAFDAANRAVRTLATTATVHQGMGTTVVAAVLRGRTAAVGHLGDSRAYRYTSGRLHRITRDHSVVQELVDAGLLTEADARDAPNRHIVTRALGLADAVTCDVVTDRFEPGDILLLCSDGLTEMLGDDEIGRHCERAQGADSMDLPALVSTLVDAALAQGGIDNVTVVGLRVP
jgi:PPM family protein phosphatase